MHAEEKDEAHLGDFDERIGGPAQKPVEGSLALEGKRERQKMQGQKGRQRQAREPMDQGGKPEDIAAMPAGVEGGPPRFPHPLHASTTAATAVKPSAANNTPKLHIPSSSAAPRKPTHSAAIILTPIAAWVAAATTKAA